MKKEITLEIHNPMINMQGIYDYYDLSEFTVEGMPFYEENKSFFRLPQKDIKKIRSSLVTIAHTASGAVIRFKTNSKSINIRCTLKNIRCSAGMPYTGELGIDVYRGKEYLNNFRPNYGSVCTNLHYPTYSDKLETYTLYLPVFSEIESFKIGVQGGSIMQDPDEHKIKKPICFYGSSVTHGACASRPGLTYPARAARKLDAPFINFGFAGNCRGDEIIAEYISKLDLSCFFYAYSYNSPTPEFLEKTHEKFFNIVRNSQKDLPIVIMSDRFFDLEPEKFDEVVKKTYLNAKKNGDKNVYYLDHNEVFDEEYFRDFSSDRLHPNDEGFRCIGDKVYEMLNGIFSDNECC